MQSYPFFNKHFDVQSWDVEVTLRCLSMKRAGKELCRLQIRRNVSKYDSIVYIREGWGNKKEGSFWKKGAYCWEAYIDNEKVGSKYFYVEKVIQTSMVCPDISPCNLSGCMKANTMMWVKMTGIIM
jgi:hypothetical protein